MKWLDLTTHDSYFMILVEVFTNHILAQNRTQDSLRSDYGLKTSKQVPIFGKCHNFENIFIEHFQHYSISLLSKSFSNIIFTEPQITNCEEQTINHSNIYLLFDLLGRRKSIS